ncbi:MAG: hypothetical protein ACKOZT_06860 [Cyanobium sp.]
MRKPSRRCSASTSTTVRAVAGGTTPHLLARSVPMAAAAVQPRIMLKGRPRHGQVSG